jgi:uncharacterized membrane protein
MYVTFNKFPIDLICCMIYSLALIPFAVMNVEGIIRIIIGLPFVLFIPGYTLLFFLFPRRNNPEKGIDFVERIAFSFGLSMTVVSLIGIGLFYTPFGLHLEAMVLYICCFTIGVGGLAFFRWYKIHPDARFFITFSFSLPKANDKYDRILSVVLILIIILTIMTFIFVVFSQKGVEKSTEFYILGPREKAIDYPKNLTIDEKKNLFIGIINHEFQTMNYTIEIWLINQTSMFNKSLDENVTVYNHMWFMDKFSIELNQSTKDKEHIWIHQWEYNYTFSINRTGNFRLVFLLYKIPTEEYNHQQDYRELAKEKFYSAYKSLYLWLNVVP